MTCSAWKGDLWTFCVVAPPRPTMGPPSARHAIRAEQARAFVPSSAENDGAFNVASRAGKDGAFKT
jgi:hypothetical protein